MKEMKDVKNKNKLKETNIFLRLAGGNVNSNFIVFPTFYASMPI